MALEREYVGYFGRIQETGQGRFFNITNVGNDEVTIVFSGNFTLEAADTDTYVTITDVNGNILVDNQLISLVEFGETGTMADGVVEGHSYTVMTIGGKEYMFLDEVPYPTLLSVNPFFNGIQFQPLSATPITDQPHDICFVNGTHICTPYGEVAVEDLQAGDLVVTRDNGTQKIVWAGARKLNGSTASKRAPVRISAGAFGRGLPARDLLVSPQHRIMISDWRAELLFGASEVLIAAKHLINDSTVRIETGLEDFTYHHILFEKHETVFSEGLPTESFHPGDMAMAALGEESRAELLSLFPELVDCALGDRPLSHLTLKGFEAKALTAI